MTAGFADPQEERLHLMRVPVIDSQVQAEPVPTPAETAPEVLAESLAQVRGQAKVVEAVPTVARVDAVPPTGQGPDDARVVLKQVPGDVLGMLADQTAISDRHRALLGSLPGVTHRP